MIDFVECLNCKSNPDMTKKMEEHIRTDERNKVLDELYNEIILIESFTEQVLSNTSKENELQTWFDLNGKLSALTKFKDMISDKLKEQGNE